MAANNLIKGPRLKKMTWKDCRKNINKNAALRIINDVFLLTVQIKNLGLIFKEFFFAYCVKELSRRLKKDSVLKVFSIIEF